MADERLILASRSPQRRAILEQLGVEFHVEAPAVEELTDGDPRELVVQNARRKAAAVADRLAGGAPSAAPPPVVLGVDTAVVLDGRAFGKPADADEARAVLERLSGRDHHVMSGLSVRDAGGERTEVAVTRVRFRDLSTADLVWYVETGEWRERAGGYAIQGRGAALVAEIEGDYLNVVGLPVGLLLRLVPRLLAG